MKELCYIGMYNLFYSMYILQTKKLVFAELTHCIVPVWFQSCIHDNHYIFQHPAYNIFALTGIQHQTISGYSLKSQFPWSTWNMAVLKHCYYRWLPYCQYCSSHNTAVVSNLFSYNTWHSVWLELVLNHGRTLQQLCFCQTWCII